MAILHESDEGTMNEVRKIAVRGRRGTEGKVGRQNEYSIHMEVRTLYARRMFREQIEMLEETDRSKEIGLQYNELTDDTHNILIDDI